MKLVGHAAVFDSLSEDLGGFRERIAPGAFTRSLRSGRNIFALFGHDTNRVLGSTQSGSLKLAEDRQGLRFELDLSKAKTSDADTVHALVNNGDLRQMSFGFRIPDASGETWSETSNGLVRTIKEADVLEISPVAFPAYVKTDVSARSHETVSSEPAKVKRDTKGKRTEIMRKRIKSAEQSLAASAPKPQPQRPEARRMRIDRMHRQLSSRRR